ncbi:adenine phosphoribosyltransferase [candidate division NPL-UPA2 bacterium]|nr:adenine phosphoribosyltransferase [candidate division NPL-UPA2 bacterium]
MIEELKMRIRDVPDFPKKGIIFRDITTLLKCGPAFREVIDILEERYREKGIDVVVGVESRGFILASALAYRLKAGMVPIRKRGKLPAATFRASYQLEYGEDELEIHRDAFEEGARVLIVDDLLATGGTSLATVELVEKLKGEIIEIAFLIELIFLKGRGKLKGYPIFSLIEY